MSAETAVQMARPTANAPFASFQIHVTQTAGVPVHAVIGGEPTDAPRRVLAFLQATAPGNALVTFVNPASSVLARHKPQYGRDLLAFDLVLPDGIGMCMAMRVLHGHQAARVSFDMTSLVPNLLDLAQAQGLSIVLAGGVPGVAAQAQERLATRYPGLDIAAVFDGYGDPDATARAIVDLKPAIVICGFGSALQEAFLLRVQALGWRGWGFTCGGFLDQLSTGLRPDSIDYYPAWIDRWNLRWAYRLHREPSRLWRRYLFDYSRFAMMVGVARLRTR